MAANYQAPGGPVKDVDVERATTQTLLLAAEAVNKKHEPALYQSTGLLRKGFFREKADDSIRRTAASKATAGAAIPIIRAVAVGEKIISTNIERAFVTTHRGKVRNESYGIDKPPPDTSVREFIKSVTSHFVQANKQLEKLKALLLPGGGLHAGHGGDNFDTLVKTYAQFRHDLDKSALYLEALPVRSVVYYMARLSKAGGVRWAANM